MHCVVCMKQVPDTSEVRIDPKTNTLMREGVPSIINPYDVHAIEEALRLKEKYGGKVTVLTMGPPQATEALKKALAYGADHAILLTDRAFAGSDTLATSYILAGALAHLMKREAVDLILCGKQAIDGDTAQVGPGIARRLKLPLLTYVSAVDGVEQGEITLQRKLESGHEVIRCPMPALLTVVKEINEIRYASFPNLLRAAQYSVEQWSKDTVNLDPIKMGLKGSPTWVSKIAPPPLREKGEMLAKGGENPAEVATLLAEKLVPAVLVPNR